MSEHVQQPLDENPASQRHWLYGFNAFVLVIVSLVVLIFLLRICELDKVKNATKFDWSGNGANSLSGGTRKMLQVVNSNPDKYAIWSLFTDPSDQVKRDQPDQAAEQTRRREQVNDLLRQYARASSKIVVDDRGDAARDDIERQIRDKYKDDFKPYQEAVDGYGQVLTDLSKFLKNEAEAIGINGQKPGTPADEREAAAAVQAKFMDAPDELQQDQKLIQRETDSILPDWGMLTGRIGQTVGDLQALFDLFSDPKQMKEAGFPPTLAVYFTGATDKYKAMDQELKTYKAKLDALKPLAAQEILSSLDRNTVVILGDKSAKVVSQFDIYSEAAPNDRNGQGGLAFTGEQAISSALYAMAKPDKVQVVFVTASPQQLLTDTYSDMKGVLEDNNFKVLEWSPSGESQPGGPPQPNGPPPAEGKGVVWVVFTPDMNMNMMMMGGGMPDVRPVLAATREHMDRGGQVLFMADAASAMMGPAGFPYADLIKDFGLEVQSRYSVVHMQEQTDPDTGKKSSQASPFTELDSDGFVPHEITTPMMGLPAVFGPMLTNQGPVGTSTVVKVLQPLPTGVTAREIVKTPYNPDYWATSDPSGGGGGPRFNKDTDVAAPVPLMAVAVKDQGKKAPDGSPDEKRIAVIGSKMIGSNFFLDLTVVETVGDVRYRMPRFPGNSELMKNTILWLAGYENMIAVSAKSNAAARIGNVSTTMLWLVRLGLWAGVPALTLVIGGIVWAARRR